MGKSNNLISSCSIQVCKCHPTSECHSEKPQKMNGLFICYAVTAGSHLIQIIWLVVSVWQNSKFQVLMPRFLCIFVCYCSIVNSIGKKDTKDLILESTETPAGAEGVRCKTKSKQVTSHQ